MEDLLRRVRAAGLGAAGVDGDAAIDTIQDDVTSRRAALMRETSED